MSILVNEAKVQIENILINAAKTAMKNGALPECELAPFKVEVPQKRRLCRKCRNGLGTRF